MFSAKGLEEASIITEVKPPSMQLLHSLKAVAVVQVQADGQAGLNDGGLHQLDQIGVVGIGAGALGDLEDQGSVDLFGRFGDALDDLHVVDIERADGVTAVIGLLEHFGGGYQWHNDHLLLHYLHVYIVPFPIAKYK